MCPGRMLPPQFAFLALSIVLLRIDCWALVLIEAQILKLVFRHKIPRPLISALLQSDKNHEGSPIHPTAQIWFGQKPAIRIIHAFNPLYTRQIVHHNIFTLSCDSIGISAISMKSSPGVKVVWVDLRGKIVPSWSSGKLPRSGLRKIVSFQDVSRYEGKLTVMV